MVVLQELRENQWRKLLGGQGRSKSMKERRVNKVVTKGELKISF